MKKGDISNEAIIVDKLIPGGQGIATLSCGKKVFLWNVLPDEQVTKWLITKTKNHYLEGIAQTIQNESNHRIVPKDTCFLATSPWQNMNYGYELEQKLQLLIETFRQEKIEFRNQTREDATLFDIEVNSVKTDNHDFYYRNKMEYALYYDNDAALIKPAFHQRGTHRKIPINNSSIEMPAIWRTANTIIDELNRKGEEARKYQSLLLRSNQAGKVSGGLYENHQPHPDFDNLEDTILGISYSYSPNGFFQINLPVYEMALREIQKHIVTDKILDLYAGVGTIGLSVAQNNQVTLVECDKSAYVELEKNCQGKSWATPILAKSEEALSYIAPDQTVILDPPRAGCHKDLIDKLRNVRPKKLIYLSCNPSTQARDIKMLIDNNAYTIDSITPFNFFPRTPHLENLAILTRR